MIFITLIYINININYIIDIKILITIVHNNFYVYYGSNSSNKHSNCEAYDAMSEKG